MAMSVASCLPLRIFSVAGFTGEQTGVAQNGGTQTNSVLPDQSEQFGLYTLERESHSTVTQDFFCPTIAAVVQVPCRPCGG